MTTEPNRMFFCIKNVPNSETMNFGMGPYKEYFGPEIKITDFMTITDNDNVNVII